MLGTNSLVLVLLVGFVSSFSLWPTNEADTIFLNGDILTMKGEKPEYVEALAIGQGKILHAGKLVEALRYNTSRTKLYNLHGKTLLPSFVDAHSHIGLMGYVVTLCNLFPIPDGTVGNFDQLLDAMLEWQKNNPEIIEQIGWVVGYGYDDSMLVQRRHPDKHYLDLISKQRPVIVIHQSFHIAVINSYALKMLNITEDTVDPVGGHYRRYPNSNEPTGVLEESAFGDMMSSINLGAIRDKMVLDSQQSFAKSGYTTVQDGRTDKTGVELFMRLAGDKKFYLDIYSYPDYLSNRDNFDSWRPWISGKYTNRFRIAGAKIGLDGSIQGKTGWLKHPYFVPPENQPSNYSGYPSFKDDAELFKSVQQMYDRKLQVLAHVNGDAAIEQFLSAVEAAKKKSVPNKKSGFSNLDNYRTVSLHSQMASQAHLSKMVALKVIPSFFGAHAYYWGDWHRDETLGPERAQQISPAASAIARHMLFTEHTDSPVVVPNSMRLLWAVVNRLTRSRQVLGPNQRISPYQGLLSITRNAAIQAFEEKSKGTLERFKLADLVILNSNPLKVPPESILEILVTETFKEGHSIYRRFDVSDSPLS